MKRTTLINATLAALMALPMLLAVGGCRHDHDEGDDRNHYSERRDQHDNDHRDEHRDADHHDDDHR